jgi:hypothetical protein
MLTIENILKNPKVFPMMGTANSPDEYPCVEFPGGYRIVDFTGEGERVLFNKHGFQLICWKDIHTIPDEHIEFYKNQPRTIVYDTDSNDFEFDDVDGIDEPLRVHDCKFDKYDGSILSIEYCFKAEDCCDICSDLSNNCEPPNKQHKYDDLCDECGRIETEYRCECKKVDR